MKWQWGLPHPLRSSSISIALGLLLSPLSSMSPRPAILLYEAIIMLTAATPLCACTPTPPSLHTATPPKLPPCWDYSWHAQSQPVTPPELKATANCLPDNRFTPRSQPFPYVASTKQSEGWPHCFHQDLFPAGHPNCTLMLELPQA